MLRLSWAVFYHFIACSEFYSMKYIFNVLPRSREAMNIIKGLINIKFLVMKQTDKRKTNLQI
jgi:hypothetical protein